MSRIPTILISRLSFFIFFLLWIVSQLNAQDTASWLDKKITLDGVPSELQKSDLKKDDKSGFYYYISNDSSSLYIGLLLKDEIIKTKFLNAGFSIFLNSEGKEKKSYSIDFPLPDAEYDLANNPGGMMDLKGIQLMGLLHAKQYDLSGFKDGNGKQNISDDNKAGIRFALGLTDSAFLFYEVMIPLTAIFKKMNSFSEINRQNIAICFLLNAITKPSGQSSQSSNAGLPPTPVLGRGGRGNPRQSESNNSPGTSNNNTPRNFGQMEKLFQGSKTWKTVNLAKPI